MLRAVITEVCWHVLGTTCQDVRLLAILARAIRNFEVEFAQKFGPASLSAVELLGRHKMFQVTVVSVDLYRVFGSDRS
jgi:hypothetical protein